MNDKWVACCIVLLLLGAVTPVVGGVPSATTSDEPGGSASEPDDASPTAPNESTPVHEILTFDRTPDREGHVRVTIAYEVHESIDRVQVWPPIDGTVTSTTGLHEEGVTYVWERGNPEPSMTVVFESLNSDFGEDGFIEADGWALADVRVLARATSSVEGELDFFGTTDWKLRTTHFENGDGHAGRQAVYMGPHRTVEWETEDEQFTVVLPDSAARDGSDIRASLTDASGNYVPFWDTEGVTVFAVDREPGGMKVPGNPDTIVSSTARVDHPNNVWVHEYAHVRQWFNADTDLEWFVEGSAEYLAALETYQQGQTSFGEFHDWVSPDDDRSVVLAEPDTWDDDSDYRKGSRVAAALDARIRQETGGNYTLRDVIYVLNQEAGKYSSAMTHEDLTAAVERVVGHSMDDWLDRYVTTSDAPAVPEDPDVFSAPSTERDGDGDGVTNMAEKQRNVSSPFYADTDGDGLDDGAEFESGSDPTDPDTDGDGLRDVAEVRDHETDPKATDTDGDGLDDPVELDRYESDPATADTDGDGLDDGVEISEHGTDPATADTDGDGLDDGVEVSEHGTDPATADTDGDGLDDGAEVNEHGADPILTDTDEDGLTDGAEVADHETDPTAADTDGDGLDDGEEVSEFETDPSAANDEAAVRGTPTATPTTASTATPSGDGGSPGFGALAALTALGCWLVAGRSAGR